MLVDEEGGSGYESNADENTYTNQRRSERIKRHKKRKLLVNPGEVEVPGTKELSDEFSSYVVDNRELRASTAKAYGNLLFHRRDNKSLLSYLRGLDKNFHAANLTNFEDDTGAYVLAPLGTDYVYAAIPGVHPRDSSQQ